ncbi:hypothetical protein TNCV_2288281 [Trichonephila clavipes]|nr:hypothetical protein TNCV_2288281 [Trichonephila clavipes]
MACSTTTKGSRASNIAQSIIRPLSVCIEPAVNGESNRNNLPVMLFRRYLFGVLGSLQSALYQIHLDQQPIPQLTKLQE